MSFLEKIKSFIRYILAYPDSINSNVKDSIVELEKSEKDLKEEIREDKLIVYKSTILSKLYSLEQAISVLQLNYPEEFNSFMLKISNLRKLYMDNLEKSEEELTFEIDPDTNCKNMMKVIRLENEIKEFVEQNMKYDMISKRLQILITKLNVLYNVSIFHDEAQKVLLQLNNALQSEKDIISEFEECNYILDNKNLKENIVNLIAYADYLIFKTNIRNMNSIFENVIQNLGIVSKFEGIDYKKIFTDFLLDEVSDLMEFIPLIKDKSLSDIMQKRINKLLERITLNDDYESVIMNSKVWDEEFSLENTILDILNNDNVEHEKIKIKLLDKMNISVDEKDIFISPRTNTLLFLFNLSEDIDNIKLSFITKFLNSLTDEITYKEIYFILVLLDIIDDIIKNRNGIYKYIKKYINKYSYSKSEILSKKEEVKSLNKKEYIVVFKLNEYDRKMIEENLININIDYIIKEDNLYINLFYFKELENVKRSLVANAKNYLNGGIING